ncbi:MAG: MBL fold metallo-hydrolase [Haloferacaceae archaeon]
MNRTDDWYDVERVTDRGYRVVEGEGYGMYLVTGADRAAVVDAGIGVGDLRGLVEGLVDVPVALLLTHWHWDHIGAAADFDDVRISRRDAGPDGRVAVDAHTDEFVHRPAAFVEEWRAAGNDFPDGFDPDAYAIDPVEDPTPVEPGETFDLGDRRLEYVDAPGHSRGHVAVLDRSEGVLYGGDVVHRDAGLYAHFEGCDLAAYRETFERLVRLRNDGAFDALLTSHNPPFEGGDLGVLDRLRDGIDRILDGAATPERVETAWGPADRYVFDGSPVVTRPGAP